MTERDDDILDFDFFDESPTAEQQPTQRVRMPRRRPSGSPPRPPVRPPQGFAPLLRLVGLIAFAIVIVVLLVFWVQSCQGASKRNAYRHYVENVAQIATTSEQIGRDLTDALTTPGQKVTGLQTALGGLADREQQDVVKAQALDPPGALREEHQAVLQALQFRVSGLQGLAATLRTATKKGASNTAEVLAQVSQRFVASDVVWDDLFKDKAQDVLAQQGVSGVSPPDSNFLVDPALTTPESWSNVLQRLAGASTGGTAGGGPHGSALAFVKALSGGQAVADGKTLNAGAENTVTATTDLEFAVGVTDSGNSQEVGIQVTLTIEKPGSPIVKTQTIQVIDPGETKTVIFRNLGQVPFAAKTNLKVDIAPVPGEAKTDNNSASYPVIFSLG
jgi:HAMP domain-containing protein